MSLILPFDENIYENGSAFVKPDGSLLYTFGTHESFAYNYCCGEDYLLLKDNKDVDEYGTSMLTPEQLALFKLWIEKYTFFKNNMYADFMVSVLGFDKIEVSRQEAITTTCANPHVRFFNYYLMDWRVYESPLLAYNSSTDTFEEQKKSLFAKTSEEMEYEKELDEIKSRVLIKYRPLFFK